MPASKKQIAANRENAKKSAGPKTDEGKQTASQNSVKHGLYSSQIVIQSCKYKEDPAEYDTLLQALTADLKPDGLFQEHLVKKIADAVWRSRRVIRAETAAINQELDAIDKTVELSAAFRRLSGKELTKKEYGRLENNSIDKALIPRENLAIPFLRYEMRLDRQISRMFRIYRQVKRLSLRLTEQEEIDKATEKKKDL